MPGLFRLEFGRTPTAATLGSHATSDSNSTSSITAKSTLTATTSPRSHLPFALTNAIADVRRPNSMDHFKPNFTKRHSSKDTAGKRSSTHERSLSKDVHLHREALTNGAVQMPGSPRSTPAKPVTLDLIMESPPVVMLDSPEQSTGALISGRLRVTPTGGPDHPATLNTIAMYLECTTTTRRPVTDRCRACTTQVNDLYEWHFLTKPRVFAPDGHGGEDLPFSHLIPGHLPATTRGHLGSIEYSLHVRARAADGTETEYRRDLTILRALRPGNDKNSMRIFPPTHLTLHVTLPSVVHPIGEIPVLFRLTGVTTTNTTDVSQVRWRLRKVIWRIAELEKSVSPACPAHAHKVGGDGRGLAHEHERDLGTGELKRGWKTDYTAPAPSSSAGGHQHTCGQIEGEFPIAIDHTSKPQCDVAAANGTSLTHSLILELVIAEEWVPHAGAKAPTPTGNARVLRTQFALKLTQRAGLGIAWDDEAPPMYEDVPESPPHYAGGEGTSVRTVGPHEAGLLLSPEGALPPPPPFEEIRALSLED